MATATCIRNQTKQGTWSGIFPQEQVTDVQSTLFVKKLLAVAVSSISYLRAIFPEDAFGDRCLEDINLKILRDDSACPGASQVIQWVKGCFDAIDKKYLKMILVGIYENPEDPDTVIEQYTFKFSYSSGESIGIYRNNSKILSAQSAEETKKATIRLLRTIILLSQTLSPLPDDVMMTMKLLYDEDVTPADYQPPGFTDCSNEGFEFNEEAMKLRIGEVSTPFHEMKLRIATTCHNLQYEGDDHGTKEDKQDVDKNAIRGEKDKEKVEIPPCNRREAESHQEVEQVAPNPLPEETDEDDLTTRESMHSSPEKETIADANIPGSESATSANREPVTVCCPCDVNEDDGLMILCAVCNTWQHAHCFGILEADEAPPMHTCVDCSRVTTNKDVVPTDASLLDLNVEKLKEACLWRRTLLAVCETTRILAPSLAKRLGVETSYASHLIRRLEDEGYLKSIAKSKRLGKMVLKSKIQEEAITKYFKEGIQQSEEAIDIATKNIDAIVSKASDLKLNDCNTDVLEKANKSEEEDMESEENQRMTRRKRAVSKANLDYEFEINDSQEVPTGSKKTTKRRKTSIAKKSILV